VSKIDNIEDIRGRWVVDPFTEVTVNAGSLLVTAELLEGLAEFFDTHDDARCQYGRFLASREPDGEQTHFDAWDVLGLCELNEAAEFMRILAQPDQQEED
jgi:hypothetical protein